MQHGLLQAITLFEGMILDGLNRYRVCLHTGVEPRFVVYPGDDPLGFAIASNDQRRHLDASQRAMVAARLANLPKGVRSDRADLDAHQCASTVTQASAAEQMNVSRRSVQHARQVQEHAAPELVVAVDQGRMPVKTAAALTAVSIDRQQAVAKKIAEGVSASRAVRDVIPEQDRKEPQPGEEATAIRKVALTAEQLYAAYQALPEAAQDKFFARIKSERAKTAAVRAADADAENRAIFQQKVARANGKPTGELDDPLAAALAAIDRRS
jgi:hypothetical protein